MHLRAFHQAVEYYQLCRKLRLPSFLKTQLQRAASSIALNLSEGSGKNSPAERRRYFTIAMGSIRECQAIAVLEPMLSGQEKKSRRDGLSSASFYRWKNAVKK